ncbi:X-ray repair cross-complementing protein 6 [Phlyctochytrium bullatum]|nr:X-ray repair cross-complementing protein 6 [Phlyctochytrium bullatum]
MSTPWKFEEDDEEEAFEEDEQQDAFAKGRDCVIYLVDASPSMHIPQESGRSFFQKTIKTAVSLLMAKIISSETDMLGIVFYGTRRAKNSHNFENIYVYQELEPPYAKRIADLEALEADAMTFRKEVGAEEVYSFHEALWLCSSIFAKSAKKNDYKRVFIFTNNDNPNGDRPELQRAAATRANDLVDIGANLHLFCTNPAGRRFDVNTFFKDNVIKLVDDDETNFTVAESTSKMDELLTQVRQKEFKKRTAFRVPLILGEDFEIGVAGYNLVMALAPASSTWLLGATNEEVKTVTTYECLTSAQPLGPNEMDMMYPYGGRKVVFTKEEVAQIKNFGEPGLRLIGFKPLEILLRKPYYTLKHSSFIYPDDKSHIGSSTFFIQFLMRVHLRQKAVICSFIPRKNASPRLVALIPQLEELDEYGNLLTPSGFQLIHLPFADDIRKPMAPKFDKDTKVTILDRGVKVMGEIIDKVTIKNFSPLDYENPSVQKHYANLQAIALKRDLPNDVKDSTVPDTTEIERRIGEMVQQLREALPYDEPLAIEAAPKRKQAAAAKPAAAKRAKVDGGVGGGDGEAEARRLWQAGNLKKMTVAQLQEFLKAKGCKPFKKKDELIAQVDDYFTNSAS